MGKEFHKPDGECATLVPSGAGYENVGIAKQVCTAVGSVAGSSTVDGNRFVELSYGYLFANVWRVSLCFLSFVFLLTI